MKRIGIAKLKAHLSENLSDVRRGDSITVLDRRTPIATIVPYRNDDTPLRVRAASGRTSIARIPLPRPLAVDDDIVAMLLEDRSIR